MHFAFVISALTIGFMGSFHCIGMCGPIALTLPVAHLSGYKKLLGILLYNIGRVLTYGIIGLCFGWIGKEINFFGWQQVLSIALGLLMLFYCLNQIRPVYTSKKLLLVQYWQKYIAPFYLKLLRSTSFYATTLIGLLNGILPCGLVYIAIAGSITAANPFEGGLFMMLFGIGTIPSMFFLSLFGSFASIKMRNIIKVSSPIVIGCVGLLMILRGLNLNIPYLSPKMQENKVQCCQRDL